MKMCVRVVYVDHHHYHHRVIREFDDWNSSANQSKLKGKNKKFIHLIEFSIMNSLNETFKFVFFSLFVSYRPKNEFCDVIRLVPEHFDFFSEKLKIVAHLRGHTWLYLSPNFTDYGMCFFFSPAFLSILLSGEPQMKKKSLFLLSCSEL